MVQTETLRAWSLPRRRRRFQVMLLRHLALGVTIFAVSSVLIWLAHLSAGMACVWISNGLTIGVLLCINPRHRNQLLAAIFVANFLADFNSGEPLRLSLGLAVANTLEVFVATFPFRRLPVRAINLTHVRTLLKAGMAAPLLGSIAATLTLAVWMLFVTHTPASLAFLTSWYTSDALGASVVLPLYWSYRRKPRLERSPFFRFDAPVAFLLFCGVVFGLFWQTRYPFLFLLFPVLIPVIYTGAFLGAARAVLPTAAIGIAATAYKHGPLMLVHITEPGRVLILQFYLAVVLVTAFPFAVLLIEREELVTSLKRSENRYRDMARLDGLTLLPNRREFDSLLDISRQRSVRQASPLSLLLIDIDHFKKLNDQHGHTVGDEYLRKVAVAIASAVPRKTDLVARHGGEEFAVVLDSCDDEGAMMVAERTKAAAASLSRTLVAHNRPAVSISIGVATTVPHLRTSSKGLIDAADQGLYTAKRNGRGRIERGTNLIAQATAVSI